RAAIIGRLESIQIYAVVDNSDLGMRIVEFVDHIPRLCLCDSEIRSSPPIQHSVSEPANGCARCRIAVVVYPTHVVRYARQTGADGPWQLSFVSTRNDTIGREASHFAHQISQGG